MKHCSNNEKKKNERKRKNTNNKNVEKKPIRYIVCTVQNFHGSNHIIIQEIFPKLFYIPPSL